MSDETLKSTLKSVKTINENPAEYSKLNAVQGSEIHKMLKEVEKSNKAIYDSILVQTGSQLTLRIKNKQSLDSLTLSSLKVI